MPNMPKIKLALSIFLIFSLGALVGGLGTGLYAKHRLTRFVAGGFSGKKEVIMNRLNRQLQLSPDQQIQIAGILEEAQRKISHIQQKFQPEYQAVIHETAAEIRTHLNDAQKSKFEAILARLATFQKNTGPSAWFQNAPEKK